MRTIRAERSEALLKKICVACGYDGPELGEDLDEVGFHCPQCAQDLYARPPKSYAEMEGIEPSQSLADFIFDDPDIAILNPPSWWERVRVTMARFFGRAR